MKFRHIASKGYKLKVRKFQALSLSEKNVIKKNPTGEYGDMEVYALQLK